MKLVHQSQDTARRLYDAGRATLRLISPEARRLAARQRAERLEAETMLARLSSGGDPLLSGTVLVDGAWYNANFWLRFAIVRRALGLSAANEIGFTGEFNADRARETMRRFGIEDIVNLHDLAMHSPVTCADVSKIRAQLHSPQDILDYDWPAGVPGTLLYDHFLRRQRRSTVNLDDPRFDDILLAALRYIAGAQTLLDMHSPSLVVLSEVGAFAQIPLVCACITRGIPVIVVRAVRGHLRITRPRQLDDLLLVTNRPQPQDLDGLSETQLTYLRDLGGKAIKDRLSGYAADPGAARTYGASSTHIERSVICRHFGWPEERPIVTIYAPNWFDRPHAFGMSRFRDYADWMGTVMCAAETNTDVSWLFKEHPSDNLYAGVRLRDMVPTNTSPHIGLTEPDWNGYDVMCSAVGIITFHGTIGIEAPVSGIPVLVPDRGYYDDMGFVVTTTSRNDFVAALKRPWWTEIDSEVSRSRAKIYAGMHYCGPAWQGDFVYPNDFQQDRANTAIPGLLRDNLQEIEEEIKIVRIWFESKEPSYHPYKMRRWLTESYRG
jgi:hypothetical protein